MFQYVYCINTLLTFATLTESINSSNRPSFQMSLLSLFPATSQSYYSECVKTIKSEVRKGNESLDSHRTTLQATNFTS